MTGRPIASVLRERLGVPGWRRRLLLRRWAAAALLVTALVLAAAPPAGSASVPVVVAAADLTAGQPLRPADVAVRQWPAELAPPAAVREVGTVHGRALVGAARAGEPLTDVRLVGAAPAAGPDGAAVPVRLADAGVAALLVPGSRVDVVTAGPEADQPVVLAVDVTVLAVLAPEEAGRIVMIAMPRGAANRVAAASLAEQVAVTLR